VPAPRPDRLSALLHRFQLQAEVADAARADDANLLLLAALNGGAATVRRVVFWPGGRPPDAAIGPVLAAARVDLGAANPITRVLPQVLELDVAQVAELEPLVSMLLTEATQPRCGRHGALNRLCEVLVILLLRLAIEIGATEPGLLAGLAHPRLHRALVAMHDAPHRDWRSDELAAEAGMSRSHFMASFRGVCATTPRAYLSAWRLTLARQDLAAGARVKSVAARYGYGSSEALSRAFTRQFGYPPSAARAPSPS
jgi:AraC-like DNA-binding protein